MNEEQKKLDFAPGEREAIAQAAHDSSRVSLALRSAKRRWRKNWLIYGTILLIWLLAYGYLISSLTDWTLSWAFGMQLHIPWELYRLGRFLSLIVSFAVYGYAHQKRCLEMGSHIEIKRATIPGKLIAMTAVIVGLWLLTLLAIHSQRLPDGTKWRDVLWVMDLTGFVLVMLGYLITVFSLDAFTTISREQLIREEKWALGIFE